MNLEKRREILFLYDVRDSNPNGDPDEQNRPRMDLNNYNIVTDLRLKRTIRDYWLAKQSGNDNVLIRRKFNDEKGTVYSMATLVKNELGIGDIEGGTKLKIRTELPEKFIDVRAFGVTAPIDKANVSITGPVQFSIGRSLNKPNIITYGISSTVSTSDDKGQGGMGDFHVLDYSLIAFHGIACEYSSKYTKFSEDDLIKMYNAMWNGTKQLNTRSKVNHNPRLLLTVVSKENEFQIGDIDQYLHLENENVTSTADVELKLDDFVKRLTTFKNQIDHLELKADDSITYSLDGKTSNDIRDFLSDFKIKEI